MTALPPFARVRTAPALALRMWTPRRKSRSSPPTTPLKYGRSSGGQIRIISKSGSQQFHGAAYEYVGIQPLMQHVAAQCGPRTTGVTAPIHYNQFGYNIGGPFTFQPLNTDKTKVFWYWGEEWVRYIFNGFEQYRQWRRADRSHA